MKELGMALLAALAAVCGSVATAAERPGIGVVDVREVLARYKKHEDLKGKIVGHFRADHDKLKERRRELGARVAKLQASLSGSEQDAQRVRTVKEIELQEYLLKLDYRELQKKVKAANDRLAAVILGEISAACRRIGEAQGYYLILKKFGPEPGGTSASNALEAFQLDSLLYHAPEADLTSQVLDLLEDAYEKGIALVPFDDGQLFKAEKERE
jgi:Skp family chaperone for outer membrane proteins